MESPIKKKNIKRSTKAPPRVQTIVTILADDLGYYECVRCCAFIPPYGYIIDFVLIVGAQGTSYPVHIVVAQ